MSDDLGYPSDCTGNCDFKQAPLGFTSVQRVRSQCQAEIKTFIGIASSIISQEDADMKALSDAQYKAEVWYRTTACYAQNQIDIVIGEENL